MGESKNISFEDWSNFFKEIAPIFEKRRIILDEKRKRGDFFNVFSILGMERKEIRHSAFLSALLNPNGEHGLGNLFLSDFIRNIVQKQKLKFEWDCNDVYVNTEEPTEEKNGRMDIYMESKGKIIIIENKIDAKDGVNQLICYDNHARTIGNNHCLLYLTLNGQCASKISTDSKDIKLEAKKDYFPISYKDDILPWLERCLEIATLYPKVRETIAQYMDLIKKLTNIDNNMDENILNLILANENIDITAYLLDNEDTIKLTIFKKTIKEITNHLEKNDTSIKWEHSSENNEKYLFRPKGWQYFWFTIWLPTQKGCFFSIYCEEEHQVTISETQFDITLKNFKKDQHKNPYPFGETYLQYNYKELLSPNFMKNIISHIKCIMENIKENNEKMNVQLNNNSIRLADCFKI